MPLLNSPLEFLLIKYQYTLFLLFKQDETFRLTGRENTGNKGN